MDVLLCMVSKNCGGRQEQKLNLDTFQELLIIPMGRLSEKQYKIVEIWESKDLNVSSHIVNDSKWAKKMLFGKAYRALLHAYVPTVNHSYLSIRFAWLSQFIEDQLTKVYDWYIAFFWPTILRTQKYLLKEKNNIAFGVVEPIAITCKVNFLESEVVQTTAIKKLEKWFLFVCSSFVRRAAAVGSMSDDVSMDSINMGSM